MQDKIAEITIKFIKHEASDIKYICNGLEVFELLGIIKNEERKALLLKLRQALQKEALKIADITNLIKSYPKIKSRAYEQLIEQFY